MTLVAISASYGALGNTIGPFVAEALGVPFIDRAIPMAVAARLEVSVAEAVAHDEQASLLERIVRGFIGLDVGVPGPLTPEGVSPAEFRLAAERFLRRQAAIGEGVMLGRGAVVVLQDDPRVLRVRLTGTPASRLAVASARVGEAEAARAMHRLDRAHRTYMRYFYGVDIDDPSLYHLVIDSTALAVDASADMIATAARALSAELHAAPWALLR
jgi:hypothetical protein